VLRLGEAAGIEYARALDTLRVIQSGQQSVLDRWRDVFDTTSAGPRLETGDLHLFDKDIPLALELARQSGLDLPIIEQICEAGLRLGEDADQA
jgi:3-hydroxyisobutyrate dehydrogenase-like beta-hydroxyacid dehydrogenase